MLQASSLHQIVSKKEKIFSCLVVFMALLHVYEPPSIPITFGEILMFICIPLYNKRNMQFPFNRQEIGFILFFLYMAISSMILGIIFDAPMSKYFSIARAGFYWVLIFYFGKNLFNRDSFEKWMIVFSVVLSILIFFQLTIYLVTGKYVLCIIPGLKISNGTENALALYQHDLSLASFRGFIRPCGFLAEPAHASQLLFVSITTVVCNKVMLFKKKILLVVLFSAAILVTQSTTGIVLLGLVWLLFMSIEKRLSVCRLPLVLTFIAISFYIFWGGAETGFSAVERIVNIANATEIDGSSNVRLNNGVSLFSDLPFVFKVFGTGAGLSEYVFNNLDFKDASSYMNALAGIFFSSGMIGGGIWIGSLIIMFVMSGLLGKSLVVGFFIMTLGCSVYCQPPMVWIFLLVLADIKEKNSLNPKLCRER